jgi:hypothetical protein
MIFAKRKFFLQNYVNCGHDFRYVEGLSAKLCGKIKV